MDDNERWFVKKACAHCPFRRDVKPFLHPERAEDIAYSAQNAYSEFHCHKTVDYDDDESEGEGLLTSQSLICAGFLEMQINEAGIDRPEGFPEQDNVYCEANDMIWEYEHEWDKRYAKVS